MVETEEEIDLFEGWTMGTFSLPAVDCTFDFMLLQPDCRGYISTVVQDRLVRRHFGKDMGRNRLIRGYSDAGSALYCDNVDLPSHNRL